MKTRNKIVGAVVIAGLALAALSFQKRKIEREAYTSEARLGVTRISYFAQEIDLCAATGGSGSIGPTPAMNIDCNAAVDGRCVPAKHPDQPWEYPVGLWGADSWVAVEFSQPEPHRYHYALEWEVLESGECEYRALAFGDLDDDRSFSTYERVLPWTPENRGEMSVSKPLD